MTRTTLAGEIVAWLLLSNLLLAQGEIAVTQTATSGQAHEARSTFLMSGRSDGGAMESDAAKTHTGAQSTTPQCDFTAAKEWIAKWLAAWDLTSGQILRLGNSPAPELVFYDDSCVYTTSAVTVSGTSVSKGPGPRGMELLWRAAPHGGTLILPNSTKVPVQLMSFANATAQGVPFFVMAAPEYWKKKGLTREGDRIGVTPVFLHEFAHTRQIKGMLNSIGAIESAWKFQEEVGDDFLQERFGSDPAYVAAYTAERDLLYRAAAADSIADVRTLAAQALAMIRNRHERWFVGDNVIFRNVDTTFLSLEGAGQWAGYAWLAHPSGGSLPPKLAADKMRGARSWTQDEGLGLFLIVDRLLPEWPSLVFGEESIGAFELLERAIRNGEPK